MRSPTKTGNTAIDVAGGGIGSFAILPRQRRTRTPGEIDSIGASCQSLQHAHPCNRFRHRTGSSSGQFCVVPQDVSILAVVVTIEGLSITSVSRTALCPYRIAAAGIDREEHAFMRSPVGNGSPKSWWTLQLWERAGRFSRFCLVLGVLMLALPGCMTTGHQSAKSLDSSVRSAPPRGALNDPPTNQRAHAARFPRESGRPRPGPRSRSGGWTAGRGVSSRGCTSGVGAAASAAESPQRRSHPPTTWLPPLPISPWTPWPIR